MNRKTAGVENKKGTKDTCNYGCCANPRKYFSPIDQRVVGERMVKETSDNEPGLRDMSASVSSPASLVHSLPSVGTSAPPQSHLHLPGLGVILSKPMEP